MILRLSVLLVVAAVSIACGSSRTASSSAIDSGSIEPGDDAANPGSDGAVSDSAARDATIAPGWKAPFALDPAALGLTSSLTWDFTKTEKTGTADVVGAQSFENVENPAAPVSGPGVARALFAPDGSGGASFLLRSPGTARRYYFRTMVALSAGYALGTRAESFISLAQRGLDGKTVGQSTIDLVGVDAEKTTAPIALRVGTLTPNGPSYKQPAGSFVTRGSFHQIEAYFVINTTGANNGVARVWLDGVNVLDKGDISWAPAETYWYDVVFRDLAVTPMVTAAGQYRDHDHLEAYWSDKRE